MSKARRDREFLVDMLLACEKILEYTRGTSFDQFRKNNMALDAVVRNIEILGEASKRISEELKSDYPEVEWNAIARTRDKVIHFYFGVDVRIIWDIVVNDIPLLRENLQDIAKKENWL